jgi:hypothetical protein
VIGEAQLVFLVDDAVDIDYAASDFLFDGLLEAEFEDEFGVGFTFELEGLIPFEFLGLGKDGGGFVFECSRLYFDKAPFFDLLFHDCFHEVGFDAAEAGGGWTAAVLWFGGNGEFEGESALGLLVFGDVDAALARAESACDVEDGDAQELFGGARLGP